MGVGRRTIKTQGGTFRDDGNTLSSLERWLYAHIPLGKHIKLLFTYLMYTKLNSLKIGVFHYMYIITQQRCCKNNESVLQSWLLQVLLYLYILSVSGASLITIVNVTSGFPWWKLIHKCLSQYCSEDQMQQHVCKCSFDGLVRQRSPRLPAFPPSLQSWPSCLRGPSGYPLLQSWLAYITPALTFWRAVM